MEILIRALEKTDYELICDLIHNELGYDTSSIGDIYKRLDTIRNHKDYQTFVAVYDNRVIGFIGLCKGIAFEFDGQYFRIIALAVDKKYQNIGIGKQLINKAEQHAKRKNAVILTLNSGLHREKTHAFYEHRGFVKKGYSFRKFIKV